MSNISQFGIPGVGGAQIRPNLQHQFSASFLSSTDGTKLDVSDQLSQQVIKFGSYTTNVGHPFGLAIHSNTSFVVEDDIANQAVKALQQLMKNGEFTLELKYLDGGHTVVRTVRLIKARIHKLQFSKLDYAVPLYDAEDVTVYNVTPSYGVPPLIEDIGSLINGVISTTKKSRKESTAALTIHVDISYDDVELSFPN